MNSIHFQSPVLPLLSQPVHQQQLNTENLVWPSSQEPVMLAKLGHKKVTRTRAIKESLILGVTSQAKPGGDVSVLIQTGALLFFVYGIANFVAPYFISKYYGLDKAREDPTPNDGSTSASEDDE